MTTTNQPTRAELDAWWAQGVKATRPAPPVPAAFQRPPAAKPTPAPPAPSTAVAVPAAATVGTVPPNGDTLLHDTRRFLRHFVWWSSPAALTVATCAAAAMNAKDPDSGDPIWEYAFKILVTAAEYGAGKTWQAKTIASLTPKPKTLLEPTKPSFIDLIGDQNTIIVTEIDKLFATPGRNTGLGAVMNGCYEPGNYSTRKRGSTVQEIHLFNHQILDGKDAVFSTLREDTQALLTRCLVIPAVMAPNGWRRPMWNKVAQEAARTGQAKLAAWMAEEVLDGMGATLESLAPVPLDCNPRRRTLYESLFTVAARADMHRAERGADDGYWTAELTAAAEQLESTAPDIVTSAEVDDFMANLPADTGMLT